MSDTPLIIVNPKSGRGLTEQKVGLDHGATAPQPRRVRYGVHGGIGDGIRIAEEEALKGRRILIAMGGDGTISEVVTGILKSGADAEFGFLPRGTGGDFRRTLSISLDIDEAAKSSRNRQSHRMDVGKDLVPGSRGP